MRDIIERRRKPMKKVGVLGNGFVGESQAFAFSPTAEVKIFDVDPLKSMNTLDEVHDCDFIFVCVPTPLGDKGWSLSVRTLIFFIHTPRFIIYNMLFLGCQEKNIFLFTMLCFSKFTSVAGRSIFDKIANTNIMKSLVKQSRSISCLSVSGSHSEDLNIVFLGSSFQERKMSLDFARVNIMLGTKVFFI